MSDQSKEEEETRVSVTLTKPYLNALDSLVEEGIYTEKGEIVRQSLRDLSRSYGLGSFKLDETPPRGAGRGG